MFFATVMQQLSFVRDLFNTQDANGTVTSQIDQTASRDDKRMALLSGARPPCGCDPAKGPTPCDQSILAVLSQEPSPGCPNA
jgi:hypothetical protein